MGVAGALEGLSVADQINFLVGNGPKKPPNKRRMRGIGANSSLLQIMKPRLTVCLTLLMSLGGISKIVTCKLFY